MSFNIQKFSRNSINEKKDIDELAKIIRDINPDIIAIQEILHPEVLKILLQGIAQQFTRKISESNECNVARKSNRTGEIHGYTTTEWEGRWAKPISKYGDNISEGYAFIWNKRKIKLVSNYDNSQVFEPRIETFTRKTVLARPPFIGRFTPINSRYEFRLINTHIVFSKPSALKDVNNDFYNPTISDIKLRIEELKALLDNIYTSWDKKRYDINHIDTNPKPLSHYTFLMGDYNLSNHQCNGIATNTDIITVIDDKTTLKQKPKNSNEHLTEETAFSEDYDHFSFGQSKYKEHNISLPEARIADKNILFDRFDNNSDGASKYDKYRDSISDHLPILLTFDIKKPYTMSSNSINSFATFSNNITEHFKEKSNG